MSGHNLRALDSFRDANVQWELAKLDPKHRSARISTAAFLFHVIHEGFVGNVPVEVLEKFPGNWTFFTFVLTYTIFFGCYVGFFIWAYVQGASQTFISLDSNAGNCQAATKPLSGTYLASNDGAWEGSTAFRYTDAKFVFQFNELQANSQDFQVLITQQFSVSAVAAQTAENDVATNALLWMHYRKAVVMNDKFQVMKLYSSPSDVFDRRIVRAGTYFNVGPDIPICLAEYAVFDAVTAYASISFVNNTLCARTVGAFGALAQLDGGVFRTRVQLSSHTTAAAINANILGLSQLEQLAILDTVDLFGYTVQVSAMYDPQFQRSDTLVCSDFNTTLHLRDDRKQICFVDENGSLLLPMIAHLDEHCASCGDNATLAAVPCDTIALVSFYLFFPNLAGNYSAQVSAYMEYFGRVSNAETRRAVSRLVMHQNATSFSEICPDCGILWVLFVDDRRTISPYRRQLPDGLHCVDSVSTPDFAKLGSVPPATLHERYYECRASLPNNVMNAVGLSFGNTSVFAVSFLAFFLPVLFYLTKKIDPHKKLVDKYVHGNGHAFGSSSHPRSQKERPQIIELENPADKDLRSYLSGIPELEGEFNFEESCKRPDYHLLQPAERTGIAMVPAPDASTAEWKSGESQDVVYTGETVLDNSLGDTEPVEEMRLRSYAGNVGGEEV